MKTAVEWFAEQLGITEIVGTEYSGLIRIYAEAKQMNEEQIIKAYEGGETVQFENAEQYYNQTFKQ
jgi:hypothetical protein